MRRFYLRQNISILVYSLIFAFLYVTMIDWEYRGERLENVLYLVTNYMTYLGILIGIAGMAVSERYFRFIKERQEGEFVYTMPVSRRSLWKDQWMMSVGIMACSWISALLLLYITSVSYLKDVKAGWMILSIIAYLLADVGVVTFSMWMQTRIKNSRKAFAASIGTIGMIILVLKEISKWRILYLHDTEIGIYALVHNAWDTFLYSHQTVDEYYKLLMQHGVIEETKLFLSGWQVDQYGWIYVFFTIIILLLIVLMVKNSLKNCEHFPGIRKLPKIYGMIGTWMVVFSLINEISFTLPCFNNHGNLLLEYIDAVRIEGGLVDIKLKCFAYYLQDGVWEYHPQIAVVIVVLSVIITAICVCFYQKRHCIFKDKIQEKEAKA
ncbi:MAG: hypothetical protein Q4E73_05975 [Lachnospiraceae bacterium]|nr:hypothetical protein [Lachnospiraceae bacterium]